MKRFILTATTILLVASMVGCAAKSVNVYGETETTETVRSRTLVDTGTDISSPDTKEPVERSSTHTETKERVIERKPVVE